MHAQSKFPGAAGADDASHAWVIAQVPGEKSATLVHIPPRTPTGVASPSVAGRVRAAATLNRTPMALAAQGDTVYLAFAPEVEGPIEIASLSVVPTSVQDHWVRQPRDRLRFLPSIEDADALLSLVHDGSALHAIVERDEEAVLLELQRSAWVRAEVQPAISLQSKLHAFPSRAGIVIVERSRSGAQAHTSGEASWATTDLGSVFESAIDASGDIEILGIDAGEIIAMVREGPNAKVLSIREDGWFFTGEIEGLIDELGEAYASAILPSTSRLVLVWTEAERKKQTVESALPAPEVVNPVRRVIEFSLIEGRVLYSGPAVVRSPVTVSEFRSLALLLFLIMGLVLLVVLRPVPAGAEIVLPPGLAIAGPARRLLATLIDATIGISIVARFSDLTFLQVLGPIAVPETGRLDIGPLALAIGVNVLHTSFGEAFLGRTFGKWLTGLIVARVDPESASLPAGQFRPPAPIRALGRNLIKWFLPPVAMLALTDPSGRHRGDLFARSAVLCRANEPLSDH